MKPSAAPADEQSRAAGGLRRLGEGGRDSVAARQPKGAGGDALGDCKCSGTQLLVHPHPSTATGRARRFVRRPNNEQCGRLSPPSAGLLASIAPPSPRLHPIPSPPHPRCIARPRRLPRRACCPSPRPPASSVQRPAPSVQRPAAAPVLLLHPAGAGPACPCPWSSQRARPNRQRAVLPRRRPDVP